MIRQAGQAEDLPFYVFPVCERFKLYVEHFAKVWKPGQVYFTK